MNKHPSKENSIMESGQEKKRHAHLDSTTVSPSSPPPPNLTPTQSTTHSTDVSHKNMTASPTATSSSELTPQQARIQKMIAMQKIQQQHLQVQFRTLSTNTKDIVSSTNAHNQLTPNTVLDKQQNQNQNQNQYPEYPQHIHTHRSNRGENHVVKSSSLLVSQPPSAQKRNSKTFLPRKNFSPNIQHSNEPNHHQNTIQSLSEENFFMANHHPPNNTMISIPASDNHENHDTNAHVNYPTTSLHSNATSSPPYVPSTLKSSSYPHDSSVLHSHHEHYDRDIPTNHNMDSHYNSYSSYLPNVVSSPSSPPTSDSSSSCSSSCSPTCGIISWFLRIYSSFIHAEHLHRSFCFGAIDGMLTGSGITAACTGLNILPPIIHLPLSNLSSSYTTSATWTYPTMTNSILQPQWILVALCISACSADAICIAMGHIWSTYVVQHTQERTRQEEMERFLYFPTDSKARLASIFMNRGMLKMDAISIVDVLSGYPDIMIQTLMMGDAAGEGSREEAMMVHSMNRPNRRNHSAHSSNQSIRRMGSVTNHPNTTTVQTRHEWDQDMTNTQVNDAGIGTNRGYGSVAPINDTVYTHTNREGGEQHHGYGTRYFGLVSENETRNTSGKDVMPTLSTQEQKPEDYEYNDESDNIMDSSGLENAVKNSWGEGIFIMISFCIFSIVPSMIYISMHILLQHENEISNDIVNSHSSGHDLDRGWNYQESVSPTTISLLIASSMMALLGIWKSRFFSTHPMIFGLETVLVFFCNVLWAYGVGYVILYLSRKWSEYNIHPDSHFG